MNNHSIFVISEGSKLTVIEVGMVDENHIRLADLFW